MSGGLEWFVVEGAFAVVSQIASVAGGAAVPLKLYGFTFNILDHIYSTIITSGSLDRRIDASVRLNSFQS